VDEWFSGCGTENHTHFPWCTDFHFRVYSL